MPGRRWVSTGRAPAGPAAWLLLSPQLPSCSLLPCSALGRCVCACLTGGQRPRIRCRDGDGGPPRAVPQCSSSCGDCEERRKRWWWWCSAAVIPAHSGVAGGLAGNAILGRAGPSTRRRRLPASLADLGRFQALGEPATDTAQVQSRRHHCLWATSGMGGTGGSMGARLPGRVQWTAVVAASEQQHQPKRPS